MSLFFPLHDSEGGGSSTACSVDEGKTLLGNCGVTLSAHRERERTYSRLTLVSFPAAAEGQVMVTDLGSTNGTFIDGVELDPMVKYPLEFGSEVVFGENHGVLSRICLAVAFVL